jgi:hypothetical protein
VRLGSGLIIGSIIAISVSSCKNKGEKDINQGEIHYNIEYIGNVTLMPKEVMPKILVVSFKDDKILFDISAPFGNSGILNLSNPKEDIFDTYISLLTWRYFYAAKPGETHPGFGAMKGINIKKTARTTLICGFNCKSAEVRLPDSEKVYEVWYTNEIDVKNPNIATPFSEIDGVLMDFFFLMGPAEMHFTAETVYKKEIPDKTFERRTNFARVSRENIEKFLDKMISM